jgi:hypothetical protein|tara:strand:+ start:133 stop:492 length:360 start_codon:yes stop_codon:yes gene_type:complete
MRKTKESLYLAAIRLHQKIRGGLPKNWHEKNFTDSKHENDQVKKILKEISKLYDSRSLFEMASEAHQKVFGSPPFKLGDQATDDATAIQILKSIVDGIPYNETQNNYDPISPKWRNIIS